MSLRYSLVLACMVSGGLVAWQLAQIAGAISALLSPWSLWLFSPYLAVALLALAVRGRVSWPFLGLNALVLAFAPVVHASMLARPDAQDGIAVFVLPLYQGFALFLLWFGAWLFRARFVRHWRR